MLFFVPNESNSNYNRTYKIIQPNQSLYNFEHTKIFARSFRKANF